jgi:hypothetical protein
VSTLVAGINDVATSLTVQPGDGAKFPLPVGSKYFLATIYTKPETSTSARELVKVTARVGDVLTIVRAQEGSPAQSWSSGAYIDGRWTAGSAQVVRCEDEPLPVVTNVLRGLRLRTHPDADQAASKLLLLHADALVMDDGEEVLDWNNIVMDLAVSGAGGLDTGSEQASTAYQAYAIRRKSDNTRLGLLHRAKDYFLDEDSTTGEDGQHALRDAAGRERQGNGFKVDTTGLLPFIKAKVAKVGTPTGRYWFTIETDSSGLPTGTILATSRKYDISRLPTTSLLVQIVFDSPATLPAATQYHLVLRGDFPISGSNYMVWRADTSAATYGNGSKETFDGTSWVADTDDDFIFQIFITRNETAVVMPSGYDQKCLLHPGVMNDGSSNLKPFIQHDRRVYTGGGAASKIGAWPTTGAIVPLSAFLPPTPVMVKLGLGNTGGAQGLAVGPLQATDVADDGTDRPDTVVGKVWAAAGNVPYEVLNRIPVEYQAIMADGGDDGWVLGYEW